LIYYPLLGQPHPLYCKIIDIFGKIGSHKEQKLTRLNIDNVGQQLMWRERTDVEAIKIRWGKASPT